MDPAPDNRHWRRYVARALRRRCPRCGGGALFRSTFRLRRACASCGLVFRREPGALTGQMYLSAAVTQIFAAALAVGLFLLTDWSTALALAVGIPLAAAFSYAFLPYAMALWVAVEFMTDVGNRDPWVGPAAPGPETERGPGEPS